MMYSIHEVLSALCEIFILWHWLCSIYSSVLFAVVCFAKINWI